MTKLTCSHCGKPIKHSVMSPTLDKKRRNQCVECAREWLDTKLDSKNKGLTVVEWEEIRTPSEILRDSLWSIKFQSMDFEEFDIKAEALIKKYDAAYTSTIIERVSGLKHKAKHGYGKAINAAIDQLIKEIKRI